MLCFEKSMEILVILKEEKSEGEKANN